MNFYTLSSPLIFILIIFTQMRRKVEGRLKSYCKILCKSQLICFFEESFFFLLTWKKFILHCVVSSEFLNNNRKNFWCKKRLTCGRATNISLEGETIDSLQFWNLIHNANNQFNAFLTVNLGFEIHFNVKIYKLSH
jgi:hypothetical protein